MYQSEKDRDIDTLQLSTITRYIIPIEPSWTNSMLSRYYSIKYLWLVRVKYN